MSKFTDFLNLFKWDPVEDAEEEFNIEKSLNENWDKLDTKLKEYILKLQTNKVDKIEGKSLSTADYTNEEKDKLATIENNSQENIIEKIQKNGVDLKIINKVVNLILSKNDIGLNNVDNTSDLDKPLSNATKEAIKNRKPTIELLTVSSAAPTQCNIGDKYYNTTTSKIYTATAKNTWGTEGENPSNLYLYVDLEHKELYYYNGATFVSYGGGSGGGGDTLPVGSIIAYSSDTIPNGWLLCDGSSFSTTSYPELFEAIGVTYGWDDERNPKLPDLRGKVTVGKDENDTDFNELGKTGGEKTHTLTKSELPKIDIQTKFASSSGGDGSGLVYGTSTGSSPNNLVYNVNYGSQAHNNLQPYLAENFIIKAKNTVVVKGDVIQEDGTASETNVYSSVAVDNKLSKSAIVLGYSRHTQSVTSWTDTLITDASVKTQIGNKLTFSNNKVVIGEGVSHIRISAKSSFKKTVSGDCSINVKKNGESIEILDTYESIPANNWYNTAIAPSIIEVSQGDEISLHITLGSSGDVEFLAASYMTIEEV